MARLVHAYSAGSQKWKGSRGPSTRGSVELLLIKNLFVQTICSVFDIPMPSRISTQTRMLQGTEQWAHQVRSRACRCVLFVSIPVETFSAGGGSEMSSVFGSFTNARHFLPGHIPKFSAVKLGTEHVESEHFLLGKRFWKFVLPNRD